MRAGSWFPLGAIASIAMATSFATYAMEAGQTALPPPERDIVKVGAEVFDRKGECVGTVVRIKDELAVIDTGAMKITLTRLSFAKREKGLILAMDRVELEAAAASVQAEGDAAILEQLTPDAPVYGPDGQIAARVVNVTGRLAALLVDGAQVKLDLAAFGRSVQGATIDLTESELKALVRAEKQDSGSHGDHARF